MLERLSAFKGKRILITGHTGFKGTWLSRTLVLAGAEVYGIALKPEVGSIFSRINNLGIQNSTILDLRDRNGVNKYFQEKKFDGAFHLAAQPLVLKSYEEPVETFETNVIGTANILNSILQHDASKWVVVITTDKVYKNVEKLEGYSEDESLGGKDPYSASKAATEMVVSAWQTLASLKETKVTFVSVRAGNVIGGGDTADNRLIPDLIRGFKNSHKTIIRYPNAIRPWQHVLDPLSGYLMLGEKLIQEKRISNAYNFGPGEESKLTVQEMAEIACEQWQGNLGIDIQQDPNSLPESGLLWLSSDLANQELGWKNKLEAEEVIRWTIEWEHESMKSSPLEALDSQIKEFFGELE
jgi:CDP-glucose 4,6-dehydratase